MNVFSRCGVKFQFGVITNDAIPAESIRLYKNYDDSILQEPNYFKEPKPFETLLQPSASGSGNLKYVKSVALAPKLLTSVDKGDRGEKEKKKRKLEDIKLVPLSGTFISSHLTDWFTCRKFWRHLTRSWMSLSK